MTVGKKLLVAFGTLFVLIAILSCVVLVGFRSMSNSFTQVVEHRAAEQRLAIRVETAVWAIRASNRGAMIAAFLKDPKLAAPAKEGLSKAFADANDALDQMSGLADTAETKADIDEAKATLGKVAPVISEVVRLWEVGDSEAASRLSAEKSTPWLNRTVALSKKLQAESQKAMQDDKQRAARQTRLNQWTAIIVIMLTLMVGAAVLFVINQITATLRQLAAELSEGSNQVAGAASQVSGSSQSLAQGSSEQAASLEETSASTEEINSMTHKNAENSQVSAQLMAEVAQQIGLGNQRLGEMVASMKEINESSAKISKIIKVIDEIAFQTNILSLNAAVEAARAGEAGMGFAVVADEVRNLAQRSAQAAKDTTGLIEESIAKSNQGRLKLDEVTHAILGITEGAAKVKILVEEVHVGSQEQARGLDQIVKAITQMEHVTQKTAASAEESASAGQELSAQSECLRGLVRRLASLVGGIGELQDSSPNPPSATGTSVARNIVRHRAAAPNWLTVDNQPGRPALATAGSGPNHSAFPPEQDFKDF
jgi:methyl-accepting chemotaxis protein/methyl-accepting chemotaxis protein-1 (serine sensor receptor)